MQRLSSYPKWYETDDMHQSCLTQDKQLKTAMSLPSSHTIRLMWTVFSLLLLPSSHDATATATAAAVFLSLPSSCVAAAAAIRHCHCFHSILHHLPCILPLLLLHLFFLLVPSCPPLHLPSPSSSSSTVSSSSFSFLLSSSSLLKICAFLFSFFFAFKTPVHIKMYWSDWPIWV